MDGTLTSEQREAWDRDGFFIVRGFAATATVEAMIERIAELARSTAARNDRTSSSRGKAGLRKNRTRLTACRRSSG
jgi:hypothetical protein